MKNIAILMTVHNRKDKTLNCLQNIFNQAIPSDITIKVYLTNDGCTDGTIEAIQQLYSHKQIHIINGDGNLFWNRGMIAAWNTALLYKPDYYLWLNDDTILFNDAIKKLINVANQYTNNSIIVGQTCDISNKTLTTYGGRSKKWGHPLIDNKTNKPIECDTFNGNIVLISHKIFKNIGMLDPYFHHSFGDIEYGLRAQKAQICSYIVPGYLGKCARNNPIPIFQRKGKKFIERAKLLYSPLGHSPKEEFYITKKYYSIFHAIAIYIKLHINLFITK